MTTEFTIYSIRSTTWPTQPSALLKISILNFHMADCWVWCFSDTFSYSSRAGSLCHCLIPVEFRRYMSRYCAQSTVIIHLRLSLFPALLSSLHLTRSVAISVLPVFTILSFPDPQETYSINYFFLRLLSIFSFLLFPSLLGQKREE